MKVLDSEAGIIISCPDSFLPSLLYTANQSLAFENQMSLFWGTRQQKGVPYNEMKWILSEVIPQCKWNRTGRMKLFC